MGEPKRDVSDDPIQDTPDQTDDEQGQTDGDSLLFRLKQLTPTAGDTAIAGLSSELDSSDYQFALSRAIATAPIPHAEVILPETIGPYRIGGELGRGAMGIVVSAEELTTDDADIVDSQATPLAMKLLWPSLANIPNMRERFMRESRAIASLHHPGIVAIAHSGEESGWLYHVMERIDGCSVADLLRRLAKPSEVDEDAVEPNADGPSSSVCDQLAWRLRSATHTRAVATSAAMRMVASIAAILEHAHDNHIVHRDIKPSNLLIDRNGSVRVSDFGLAGLKLDTDLTGAGQFLGTLRYSGMERLSDDTAPDEIQYDISSLGLTMYELLTGRPAWDGATPAVIVDQIRGGDPPAIHSIVPGIHPGVDAIFRRCIASSSDQRYSSMRALRSDLMAILQHQPIANVPPPMRRRRWKTLAALLIGAVAFAILMTLFYLEPNWMVRQPPPAFVLHRSANVMAFDESPQDDSKSNPAKEAGSLPVQSEEFAVEPVPSFQGWGWTWPSSVPTSKQIPPFPMAFDLLDQVRGLQIDEDDPRKNLVHALKHIRQKQFAIEIDAQERWVVIPFNLEPLPQSRNLVIRGRFQKLQGSEVSGGIRAQFVQYHDVEHPKANFVSMYDSPGQPYRYEVSLFSLEQGEGQFQKPPAAWDRIPPAPMEFAFVQLSDQTQIWMNRRLVATNRAVSPVSDHCQFYVLNWVLELQRLEWMEIPDAWVESLRVTIEEG